MPKQKVGSQLSNELAEAVERVGKTTKGAHTVILRAVAQALTHSTDVKLLFERKQNRVRVAVGDIDFTFQDSQ